MSKRPTDEAPSALPPAFDVAVDLAAAHLNLALEATEGSDERAELLALAREEILRAETMLLTLCVELGWLTPSVKAAVQAMRGAFADLRVVADRMEVPH